MTEGPPGIRVHLDEVLADRGMTLAELSRRTGITTVNLGRLKNGHVKGAFWSTLGSICEVLGCQPGDLLSYKPIAP